MPRYMVILGLAVLLGACGAEDRDLRDIPYRPVPVELQAPPDVPPMIIPTDNPTTEAGVALGRLLFYDPILSLDSTRSCASCHLQERAFTDGLARSAGVEGRLGARSAMSLANVGFYYKGLFWDGRVQTLEEQSLHPVRDQRELAAGWPLVERRLRRHPEYPAHFRRAFGISRRGEIDSVLVARALAQFERTLLSFDSRFDRYNRGELEFSVLEKRGQAIFFDSREDVPHAECNHCHIDPLFTNLEFHNNGIQQVRDLQGFRDKGRGLLSGNLYDNGKFRVPTLRNIALTAPYMHRGQLPDLEAVIDHYTSGGNYAENVSANVRPLDLTPEDKRALIAFLHTLTDSTFIADPAFKNPFTE